MIDRVVNDTDTFGIVALAVGAGERHAAEPDRENIEAATGERAWRFCVSDGHRSSPGQAAFQPPSTIRTEPVVKEDSSLARNEAALAVHFPSSRA